MEIPFVLRERSGGRLVFCVSGMYRTAMVAILAILATALLIDGGSPGIGGLLALAATALAALYEERWSFDPAAGTIVHRAGLLFLAGKRTIALSDVLRFRITPFVRGTLLGSVDEASENSAALAGSGTPIAGENVTHRRAWHKKPFLRLCCETTDGSAWLIEMLPARKAAVLRERAVRIAEACDRELVEGF